MCDADVESCGNCIADCGAAECNDGPFFSPGHTAIALGSLYEPRCEPDVLVANPARGVSEGEAPMPFKQGTTRVLLTPPGCGGVDDGEPTVATGVSLRDGSFGTTIHCLTLGDASKSAPIGVGLRYEVGRWVEPEPGAPVRPSTLGMAPFWFVSYSRRMHGELPPWTPEPWADDELPGELTVVFEDYSTYRFEREGDTRRYLQAGATSASASVAFAEIVLREGDTECLSTGDPARFIANNDILLHYTDGTRDVFSGVDLTFKGHVDNYLNHVVVTHGRRSAAGDAVCGGLDSLAVKRIESFPIHAAEPLFWAELEHEYVEHPRPGQAGAVQGDWELRRIVDSLGRTIEIERSGGTPGSISGVRVFAGQPDERAFTFGYDAQGVLESIGMPATAADGTDTLELVHAHPSSPASGGLSRVASQSRRINGVAGQTTTFEWTDSSDHDLEVTYPDGEHHWFAHETPQGSQQEPLAAAGRDDNGITAAFNVGATSFPARTIYDPVTRFPLEVCDQLSSGPSGDPELPGPRCTGYVYDAQLDVVSVVSRSEAGQAVGIDMQYQTFAPGNHHRLSRTTGPEGDETNFSYTVTTWLDDRVESVRLGSVIDELGNTTSYTWCGGTATCPLGLLESVSSPSGGQAHFAYDPLTGTPMLRQHPDETQQRVAYDLRGCVLMADDRHGVRVVNEYEPGQGDCKPRRTIRNPDGAADERLVTAYEYDDARNPVRVVLDENGGQSNSDMVSELEYRVVDTAGTLEITRQRSGGDGSSFITEVVTNHDVHGIVSRIEEPLMGAGRQTDVSYEFEADGGSQATFTRSGITGSRVERRDATGQVIESRDELGVSETLTYSPQSGRVLGRAVGGGATTLTTSYEYFDDGLVRRMSAPDGIVTDYDYDAARRMIRSETNGVVDEVELDAAGRPTSRRRTEGGAQVSEVTMTYEHGGEGSRVKSTRVESNDGSAPLTITNHYDSEAGSWGACQTNTPGRCYESVQVDTAREVGGEPIHRQLSYDGLGRLVGARTLGTGNSTTVAHEYQYDKLDCLRAIAGGGREQSFTCDRLGRRTSETAWGTRSWTYFSDGTVQSFTDVSGTVTTHALDASGWRVGGIGYSNEPEHVVEAADVSFTYLANDLLATMTDGSGLTQLAYDGANRLVSRSHTPVDAVAPFTVTYTYAPNSARVASLDYWGQGTVSYGYDVQGRLTTLTPFGGGPLTYTYREDGQVASESSSVMSTAYVYDPVRRLSAMLTTGGATPAAGPNILTLSYVHPMIDGLDENGNVRGIFEAWLDEEPLVHHFGYDETDRLSDLDQPFLDPELWTDDGDIFDENGEAITTLAWLTDANAYDERGNATRLMGRDYEHDEHDRITTEGFAHDANGNVVCIDEDGDCHCRNGLQDADEIDVDCGGDDCACCPADFVGGPPAFVGTASPVNGAGALDWQALHDEMMANHDPALLTIGVEVAYHATPDCSSMTVEVPTPCGDGYVDYDIWRVGGAVGYFLVPPQLPQLFNDWGHNPGFYADGMSDPFYTHPAKTEVFACSGLGVGYCSVGTYGEATFDTPLEPSNNARADLDPGPLQPGAYAGHLRAFPVYQRGAPDAQYPEGYQECFDRIDFHAQGGGVVGTCQAGSGPTDYAATDYHGAIFLLLKPVNACLG